MKLARAAILVAATSVSIAAQTTAPKKPDWSRLQFLLGSWVADPDPSAPAATGSTTFRLDLDRNIIVRENVADYPAQEDKPAQHHRDLMIIFADDAGAWRASYWDNEPHSIAYNVAVNDDGSVSLLTPADTKGPRYRILYRRTSDAVVSGRFDIALPGSDFKTYKQWTMHRRTM
jgi:hypothetical protein